MTNADKAPEKKSAARSARQAPEDTNASELGQERKRSILDSLYKDADRMKTRLPATYRPVLTSYMETVREVENGLGTVSTCMPTLAQPTQDFGSPNTNYVLRFQLMHQMIVLAMQCGLTNVATITAGDTHSMALRSNGTVIAWGDNNTGQYSNPKMDELLQAARVELDAPNRVALLEEIQLLQNQDIATIPIHQQLPSWAMRRNIDTPARLDNGLDLRWVVVR